MWVKLIPTDEKTVETRAQVYRAAFIAQQNLAEKNTVTVQNTILGVPFMNGILGPNEAFMHKNFLST